MSANIDKRIIEMQFDNKQFESGVQTSVKALDELKKGLDLEKSAKGLDALEKAGRSFSLAGISESITAISNRFSTMGIIGMTALQNITNAAYNCGKQMIDALTVDPVKTGFAEYETQTGAIQTILANTSGAMDKAGYSQQQRLDIITGKLGELNAYSDKTIYNFTEMTRNIGTFTAAGVELDTSVDAIRGIANLAAVSGSTSQQASTAMYQLSQALATGTVKYQDWISVRNAGMGGEVFKNALVNQARVMGITIDKTETVIDKKGKKVRKTVKKTVDELIADAGSFEQSLSSGWLTSDVLTSTLNNFALDFEAIAKAQNITVEAAKDLERTRLKAEGYNDGQVEEIIKMAETANDAATKVKTLTQLFDTLKESLQSGWTKSWEYIIGDFEEAKELLTGISDYFGAIIGKSAESRNAILADWKALGGRNELINSFWNVVHSIGNVAGVIRGAFEEFFPAATGRQLFDFTKKISDFTAKIKTAAENGELMGKVSRVFRGVAAALDIVRTAAGWAWGGFKKLLGMTEGAAGGLLDFIAGIGDFIVGVRDSIKNSETFQGILTGLGNAAAAVRDVVVGGIKKVGEFFTNLWGKVKATGIFTKVGDWFNSFIGKIKEWGSSIVDWVKKSETLKTAWNSIKGFFEPIVGGIADFGGKLWEAIQSFFGADTGGRSSLWDKIKARFSVFGEKIGEWFETIKPKLAEAWKKVKDFAANLFTKTIPEFLGNLKMKAVAKWPWLEQVFAFFEEAWVKVKAFCDPMAGNIKAVGEKLWKSIKNLFGGGKNAPKDGETTFGESLKSIVTGAWEQIKTFFSNLFTVTIPQWFDKFKGIDWGGIFNTAFGIFTAVKVLKAISGIGKIGSGLSAIGKGLTGFGDFIKDVIENKGITHILKNKDSFGASLLKAAAAIGLLVGAIVILANMEAEKAWTGIGMLTLIAGELLLITALFKKIDANGDALLRAAGAVALLVIPVYLLGSIDTGKALKGIAGVGLVLAELGLFMKLAGKGMNGKQSFIGLAIAVNLLVYAINGLGGMDIEVAKKGVVGLGLVLLGLGVFINRTNPKKFKGLISIALAVNMLVYAVGKMGKLNTKTILKGVLGLGGIMAAFALLINSSKDMKVGSSLLMLLTMAGTLWMFTESIKQMDGVGWQTIAAFSAGLTGVVAAMALAVRLFSGINPIAAAKAAATIAVVAAGIGAAIAIVAGFVGGAVSGFSDDIFRVGANLKAYNQMISGLKPDKIQTSITAMKDLAQMAADVALKDTSGLEGFASQISLLGARLSLFNILVSGIDTDGSSKAKTMVDDIGYICDRMAELQTKGINLEALGDTLSHLGSGIELYAIACSDANKLLSDPESQIDNISTDMISGMFAKLGEIDIDKSTIATISGYAEGGGNDLNGFARGITAIGNAMQSYSTSIAGINAFDAFKSAIVLGMLNDLQNRLPTDGNGVINWIAGEKQTLSSFADNVVVLGGALNLFAGSLTNDTAPLAERAVAVIDSLAAIQNKLDEYGGVAKFFEGEKDLGTLGTNINVLGAGFAEFTGSLNGFKGKEATVAKATGIIDSLAAIQGKLETTDGVAQWFTGTQNIGTFGTNLNTFGTKFSEFCTALAGVKVPQNIEDIEKVVDQFADVAVKLNGVKAFDISDYIKYIGIDLKQFFGTEGGIGGITVDQTKLDSIVGFINGIADIAVKLNGITDVNTYILQGLLNNLSTLTIPNFNTTGGDAATAFLNGLTSGLQNGTEHMTVAVKSLSAAGSYAADTTYDIWLGTGKHLAIGLGNGIASMAGYIRSAAVRAAAGAIKSIQLTWAVHSPSRVGYELGMNWDLGLAGGIDAYAKAVSASSADVGKGAIDTTKAMLGTLSADLTNDIDSVPTIRPVIDLSDVRSGMDDINGLFNANRSFSAGMFTGSTFNRNAASMNFDGARIAGGSDNKEVVNAINILTERFNALSEAVANMKLVTDTGALVGQIDTKMDQRLGVLAGRKDRGN